MIIIVCGLPGTGKSRLSSEIRKITGAVHLRTDEIRKRLTKSPSYSENSKMYVYDVMIGEAESRIREGKSVILDGTFYKKETRKKAYSLAERMGEELRIIECLNSEERIKKKIVERTDISDADFGVYLKVKGQWEPIEAEKLELRMEEFFDEREKAMKKVKEYLGD